MSADVTAQQDWTAVFAEVLSQPESRVQAEIWAQVFGEEYPAELAAPDRRGGEGLRG